MGSFKLGVRESENQRLWDYGTLKIRESEGQRLWVCEYNLKLKTQNSKLKT